ncbi:MAG TPA: hypothetical protein VIL86_00635 [Tepidisphaeraceae bacterium]
MLTVLRYVERNPLGAKLVHRAEQWRWGSCHVRENRSHPLHALLGAWPRPRPPRWLATVNQPQPEAEGKRIKEAIARNRPLGGEAWTQRIVRSLGLAHTLRPRGRPAGWRKTVKSDVD